jgi:hypothetical protein
VTPWAAVVGWTLIAVAPEPLTLPGFRLHLVVSEDVEPDRFEALARPGVVLWLETRSNILKRSVAERLGRAEACYVRVRPPFAGDGVRQVLHGSVHPWVALEGLDVPSYRRWAPPGTAVEVMGPLSEERFGQLRALRPQAVLWQPGEAPTPEEWARASHLSGLEVRPSGTLPPCVRPLQRAERMRLRVPAVLAEASGTGCGFALRLEIPLSLSEGELRAVLVQSPGAELWAEVVTEADASAAAALVGRLTAAVPAAPPPAAR